MVACRSKRASAPTPAKLSCVRSQPVAVTSNTRRLGIPPIWRRGRRSRRLARSQPASRRANSFEGYFSLKPIGPTKVKGVSEPVNVYEVVGLGSPAHAPATFCRTRTDQVRRTRARDGSDAQRGRTRAGRGADSSSPRWRKRAPASRASSSSSRRRTSQAGWCSRRSRSRTGKHLHIFP